MITSTEWFLSRGAESATAPRVFCFPYAGGNPRMFLDWQSELAADAEIVAVRVSGRGHQGVAAPPVIDEVIDGATAAIWATTKEDDRPIYLFGHSLGGLIAFEVARRLRDLPALRHLVVSGISAPSLLPSQRVREIARLKGKAFAEALGFFGGLAPEILADEDVRNLLLPSLIAEIRMAVGYRYRPAAPLAVNVSVIVGRDDPHVGPEQVRPWRDECENAPVFHWVDGDHFYFAERSSAVTDLLRAVVRADQYVELI